MQVNQGNKMIANMMGAFLAVSSISPMTAAWADAIPLVGSAAPDFKLPSNAGKDISLQDLKGKTTVLYFYPVRKILEIWRKNNSADLYASL